MAKRKTTSSGAEVPAAPKARSRRRAFETDERTGEMKAAPAVPSSYSRAPILELVQGPIPAHRFSILAEEMVIGRASDADISIVASELSRRHVLVKHNPATHAVSVQDLESKNGLFLNGIKVHMAVLHEGDRVQVGSAIFVFHEGGTG